MRNGNDRCTRIRAENRRLRLRIAELESQLRRQEEIFQEKEAGSRDTFAQAAVRSPSQALFQHVIDHAPAVIFAKDRQGRLILANQHLANLFHTTRAELIGKTAFDFYPAEVAQEISTLEQGVLTSGQTVEAEVVVPIDGVPRTYLSTQFPLVDAAGNIYGIGGIITDISRRKAAEAALQTALHEKDLLLKEIYHRIKNNLQIVSSLLNLQAAALGDEESKALFRDAQNRIRSIAMVHDSLYQAREVGYVDLVLYLKRLTDSLEQSFFTRATLHLVANGAIPSVPVDIAIPCGLLVNELISNALKYAFPNGYAGHIAITLTGMPDEQLVLRVGDNGVGIPEHVDVAQPQTLGLQLIQKLVQQLHGTIAIDRESGTTFTVMFPVQMG